MCDSDTAGRPVCAIPEKNMVMCSEKPVIVSYSKSESAKQVGNFKVTYQLGKLVV